jgi:hypothetical protein
MARWNLVEELAPEHDDCEHGDEYGCEFRIHDFLLLGRDPRVGRPEFSRAAE